MEKRAPPRFSPPPFWCLVASVSRRLSGTSGENEGHICKIECLWPGLLLSLGHLWVFGIIALPLYEFTPQTRGAFGLVLACLLDIRMHTPTVRIPWKSGMPTERKDFPQNYSSESSSLAILCLQLKIAGADILICSKFKAENGHYRSFDYVSPVDFSGRLKRLLNCLPLTQAGLKKCSALTGSDPVKEDPWLCYSPNTFH